MAQVTFHDRPVNTSGELPKVGAQAPAFLLTRGDLSDVGLDAFAGKRKILSIVPSLDTGVCQASTRQFNERAAHLANTVVLVVSADLPFAQKRFCESAGLANVVPLSELRARAFGEAYGVRLSDGPLAGLLARAIVVLDEQDRVLYTELVRELTQEPHYDAALAAAKG